MFRLWSPWRLAYVTGTSTSSGCIFCDAASAGDPERESLVLVRGRLAYVILNLYPYNSGHVMVVPNRHVATLSELDGAELGELMLLVQRAERALSDVYTPQGLNVGINIGKAAGAGMADHLHVHVVPRWSGDTNFMSTVGDVRVLPEEVPVSATRLRAAFEKLDG
jgi:ATP adenylyltransferase